MCLNNIQVKIPEAIQGMMLLNVVSTKWEALVPLVLSNISINNLTVMHIKKFLINWWDSNQNKKSGKPPAAKTAQKISAVKRRKSSNTFATQQNTQSTSSNAKGKGLQGSKPQAKDKTKRGTCGGKGKKREQHVHLATVAALPSPTTTTVAAIGPSGIEKRIASIGTDFPATRNPKVSLAFFPSTSHARTLAERIGEPPTQLILKTLEKRISMPLIFPEPVLVAKEGARMTTGIPFPSTSEDDASLLFSIDIDEE